jgi:hypothetical protein
MNLVRIHNELLAEYRRKIYTRVNTEVRDYELNIGHEMENKVFYQDFYHAINLYVNSRCFRVVTKIGFIHSKVINGMTYSLPLFDIEVYNNWEPCYFLRGAVLCKQSKLKDKLYELLKTEVVNYPLLL